MYRILYFASTGGSIERVFLEGLNREVLLSRFTNALTLDIEAQTLYWIETFPSTVQTSNVDGSNRTEFNVGDIGISTAVTIDIRTNTLYITDFSSGIFTISTAGGAVSNIAPGLDNYLRIEVVDSQRQIIPSM